MNSTKLLARLVGAAFLCGASAFGQSEYLFTFKGTCYQTNTAGKVVSHSVTDKTILQDVATAANITDLSTLKLVYHENGNAFGDTIDVINPKDGTVLDTLYGFYFGESFDRMILANSVGAEKRLDYVYTDQNTHSLGTALVNKSTAGTKANVNARTIQGTMKWIVTPDASNPSVKLYTGTFKTGKALTFGNSSTNTVAGR